MQTAHCQEMNRNPSLPYVFGVTHSCLLNSEYYHRTEKFSVDVMHDVLEGGSQYELKLFIRRKNM